MRGTKDRPLLSREEQQQELMYVIIDKVEDWISDGKASRSDANHHYALHSKHFPQLQHAIQKIDDPKERILEAQRNRERTDDGKVVPIPLTNGGAAPARTAAIRRSR